MANGTKVQDATRKKIEHFLFACERPDEDYPPRRLPRDEVLAYLEERLEKAMPAAAFPRIRMLCDGYDLVAAIPVLEKHLDAAPRKPEDYVRCLEFNIVRVGLGDAGQKPAGVDYYEKTLIANGEAHEHYRGLLYCYVEGAPLSKSPSLKSSIELRRKQLEPGMQNDYDRRIEHAELTALLNNDVPEAEEAHGTRTKIEAMKDDAKRIRELVHVYLEIDYAGGDYLHFWSVRLLKRFAAGGDPKIAVDALRPLVDALEKKKMPADEKDFVRRRSLRAIDFFGGELKDPERKFIAKFKNADDTYDPVSKD